MKKVLALFFILFSVCPALPAQTPVPAVLVYGASPYQDSLWGFDTSSWNPVVRLHVTLPGDSVLGMQSIVLDPETKKVFGIAKTNNSPTRLLVTVNLATGVCAGIGELGDKFSSLCFRSDGQLFGVTGDGASTPSTLFTIDKNTGAPTLAIALGNGSDGEVIGFNPADNLIYHWSGNTSVAYEKMLSSPPYTLTVINAALPVSEIFGVVYLSPHSFLCSTLDAEFMHLDTLGNYDAGFSLTPDNIRGLVMLPAFAISPDSLCINEPVYIGAAALPLFNNVIYHWGDGNTDNVGPVGASHAYSSPGTYTITIELGNGVAAADTFTTLTVTVLPCTGIEERDAGQLSLFPNPGAGKFQLAIPAGGAELDCYDVPGHLVYHDHFAAAGQSTIDLGGLADGLYFVKMTAGGRLFSTKLLIRR